MKLEQLNENTALVTFACGTKVLFSYETAVAAYCPGQGYLRTKTWHSGTTTGHINQWTDADLTVEVDQGVIDNLVKSG